ncbi:hypothetical protein COCON_G00100720 [Conger conger]|uniref:Uncharacterized protein n=1 Tax=Conger conger TaxID=82655 RepID=A0A9Q1HYG9_CONCO|nr:hypothetical protein COCON_G00100720 [Conger conger]
MHERRNESLRERERVCVVDMAPKRRLITDTFKVVKRARKKQKEDKEPAGPEKV